MNTWFTHKSLIASAGVLVSCVAFALPSFDQIRTNQKICSKNLQSIDFKPADQGLTELRQPLNLMSAATHINGNCSGSYISDQGHILTAAHCLDQCVFKEEGLAMSGPSPVGRKCKMQIDGTTKLVEVLMMPGCSSLVRQLTTLTPLSKLETPEKCLGAPDLAIVLPDTPPRSVFKCLNIARTPVTPGPDLVWTMGFPIETHRGEEDSNGKDLYVSSGRIVRSETCDQISKPGFLGKMLGRPTTTTVKPIPENMKRSTSLMLQSTVDIYHGSSGGPLINKEGQIIGVASRGVDKELLDSTVECRGGTYFESLSRLEESNLHTKPGFDLDALECNSRNPFHRPM